MKKNLRTKALLGLLAVALISSCSKSNEDVDLDALQVELNKPVITVPDIKATDPKDSTDNPWGPGEKLDDSGESK